MNQEFVKVIDDQTREVRLLLDIEELPRIIAPGQETVVGLVRPKQRLSREW